MTEGRSSGETSALADWVARLEAIASRLRFDPRVSVCFYRVEGIDDETLAKVEASWKVDRFAPAIRNLYRQANGLCFLWIATHHPYYPRVREAWTKSGFCGGFSTDPKTFQHLPTTHQVNDYPSYVWSGPDAPEHGDPPYGVIYLPPLQKALARGGGMFQTSFGGYAPDHERTLVGKVWKGTSFEEALRVFDYPRDYNPAALVMEEGVADPRVVLAEDYTSWDGGPATTFERYMEHVLATLGSNQARRDWFRSGAGEPSRQMEIDELLPPSIALVRGEGGATFAVRVEEVSAAAASELRGRKLEALIPSHRVKNVAKVLGLGPLNRSNDALIADIVAATSDPAKIDARTAGKLMAAAQQEKKTKKDFLGAFAVGAGGGETLTLAVETRFDLSSVPASVADWSFEDAGCVKQWLADLGMAREAVGAAFTSSEVVKTGGRGERQATIRVSLAAPSGLAAGASARSDVVPSGFVVHRGVVIRRI